MNELQSTNMSIYKAISNNQNEFDKKKKTVLLLFSFGFLFLLTRSIFFYFSLYEWLRLGFFYILYALEKVFQRVFEFSRQLEYTLQTRIKSRPDFFISSQYFYTLFHGFSYCIIHHVYRLIHFLSFTIVKVCKD